MYRLGMTGFDVRLVSSVALARFREALHNRWDKDDPKDAQVILHMLQIGATQVFRDPLQAGINDIQELSKTHEVVSKAKTEVWHRILRRYLLLYFPEAARFQRSSRSDCFLAFIDMLPLPHLISAMEKDGFLSAAWSIIGKKVSKTALIRTLMKQRAVLWHGPGNRAVWPVPRSKQDLEVWQCPTAPNALDGRAGCSASARQQLPRQVRTLHRPGPA
jgi:hypothetical protein